MPNLCLSCTFNPPVLKIMGHTLREETVHKLQSRLPAVTTSTTSPSSQPPKFVFVQNPPHWHLDLGQHYCDHLGRSFIFLTCIECLEGEDWKLRGTNCMTHYDSARDTTKFFFHRD
eukprot:Rhum_TRINITY_DN10797_c0_g2::Rhum_TRINITY_DN10797_c0_g2_i1::g.40331::m.40331